MLFEWDDRKAAGNIAKHSVPFEYAARVFLDPNRLDGEDKRHDYSEERRLTLGKIQGRLFVVAYTPRGEVIRLISARKANERERRQYDETLSA
ncbi:MAG: BrnT family toxin [Bryobacteraceae bacterium]